MFESDSEDDDTTWTFKCKECGGEELDVVETRVSSRVLRKELYCQCGQTEDPEGLAAQIEETHDVVRSTSGALDQGHRWQPGSWEIEQDDVVHEAKEVFCEPCFLEAEPSAWEVEEVDAEEDGDDEEDVDHRVVCAECGREVEFGWSHSTGGRIWPAECSDFNPRKAFPDEKYVEKWRERRWGRTGSSGPISSPGDEDKE
jgi:ssDNA-binding Zn-finger/Zn-ribbon topoisomerase 1